MPTAFYRMKRLLATSSDSKCIIKELLPLARHNGQVVGKLAKQFWGL